MKFIGWLLWLAIAYFGVLYFFYFIIGVEIRSSLGLLGFLAAWSGFGFYMSAKLGKTGIFSDWYSPLYAFNINVSSVVIIILAVCGGAVVDKMVSWDLAWAIIPTIPIVLLSLTFIPLFTGIAFVRTIAMIATLQTFLIMALIVYILKIDYQTAPLFEPKSTVNGILISITYFAVTGLTMLNVFALRGFESYQKMTHNQQKVQFMSHATKMKIAVHEAGHAMMYSYFKRCPESLDIYLYEQALNREPDTRGMVVAKVNAKNTKGYKEWELMLMLAGTRAELIAYKSHSEGSESDIKKWQDMAHTYLSDFNHLYTNQPTTPANFDTNKRLETKLFERHTTTIDKYLKKNQSIMMAMAKQAMVFHRLESVHIQKHLSKVKITTGFPQEDSFF
ncbi:hypothetical protein AMD27_16530 (plasmid) [Acinetobacter sp. TGL-Y2]|uniref:hypothetical protein n=1 Tax=Acinetobacter sp. TGL-Y2 TaxID=1407071 RepID=UPI0007A65E91|nr:hypothetical protein [Acinetobacter sp. TGL-Y2]AMW80522.1 hypothetical protein AMD27_16530 [Acinetobacter sp. TGL-Y2]